MNLTDGGRYQISSTGNVSRLAIGQTSDGDLGDYSCVGQNQAGTGRFSLEVLKPGMVKTRKLGEGCFCHTHPFLLREMS